MNSWYYQELIMWTLLTLGIIVLCVYPQPLASLYRTKQESGVHIIHCFIENTLGTCLYWGSIQFRATIPLAYLTGWAVVV